MDSLNNGDRYSKVQTCRGLRDRRIRLTSETAIKLYDIHDRLGFKQPTESVEWLLQQAQPAMSHLSPTQFLESEENIPSSSSPFTHNSNQQSPTDNKLQRRVSRSVPCRKHKENDRERVERRAKARDRARERTKQKLNINMELHDSTSSYPYQDASILTIESSLPQDESNLYAFVQSPAREDTCTQHVCSSNDTLSPLLSDFGFPSPNYDNAFVFEDDFYL
ncbi:hypothetical protein SUGI_0953300 [Cryptomeria japonica]|nr:hypothetical protein SUGI_0953300 [Cryptomeria japonica]